MKLETLIIELEANKDQFDEREQEFLESVCEFYYKNGFVSDKQKEWLEKYYAKLKQNTEGTEEWLMNDFD